MTDKQERLSDKDIKGIPPKDWRWRLDGISQKLYR